jgi:hypothetical protein
MADSNIEVTAGAGTPVDTRTQADGDHRQVVVLGDGTATNVQTVRAGGDAVVGLTNVTTNGTITAADVGSSVSGLTPTATQAFSFPQSFVTGTPTANSTVTLALDGQASFSVLISSNFTGTIVMERSVDGGTTWTPAQLALVATQASAKVAMVTDIRGKGLYQGECSASTHIRARCTSYSASASVRITASPAPGILATYVLNAVPPPATNSASLNNVTATTSSVVVVSAAVGRLSFSIFNDSAANMYLRMDGSAASTTNFSVKIPAGGYFESAHITQVTATWDVAVGAARVTTYFV